MPAKKANKEKQADDFLSNLGAPARRALENKGIATVKQLASHSEKEIMQLHGMGPSTLPKLKAALKDAGLDFKQPQPAAATKPKRSGDK